jgi:hypothetical protein
MADDAHPLARQGWSQLRDRSEADRRLVFDALQRRLEVGPTTTKQEQALYALRRWMELHTTDKAPSRRRYDDFRSAKADPRAWPSATLIRNAFGGSWEAATAVVEGRPEANVLVRRKTTRGKKFGAGLLKKILLAWIETVPEDRNLRQAEFIAWCLQESSRPDSRFERYPRTTNSIAAALGGWRDALAAVGALDRHFEPAKRLRDEEQTRKAIKSRISLARAPKSKRGRFKSEGLIAWLRWAQKQMLTASPISQENYGELRRRALETTRRQGRVLRIPSQATIAGRFGSWAQALEAAGLADPNAPPSHDRRPYSEAELAQAVDDAQIAMSMSMSDDQDATANGVTENEYRLWRIEELKRRRLYDPTARLPSLISLKLRFGGPKQEWKEVLRRVRAVAKRSAGTSSSHQREKESGFGRRESKGSRT